MIDRFIAIISLLSLFTIAAKANDTYLGSVGGSTFDEQKAAYPFSSWHNSNDIRMLKERVVIDIRRDSFCTHCTFWFCNHGKTQYVHFGFPNYVSEFEEGTGKLRNFSTCIKGEQIQTDTVVQKTHSYDAAESVNWFSWHYQVPANDTLIIENSYTGDLGLSPTSAIVRYIIGTGSTWEGTIADGTVIFNITNVASSNFIIKGQYGQTEIKPDIYQDSIVFRFHDYKPKWGESVGIEIAPFWLGYGMPSLQSMDPMKIRLMRNEIYARHGYVFNDKSLNVYFHKQSWYKPDANFKESMLNKHEKSFINTLLSIEQEKGR